MKNKIKKIASSILLFLVFTTVLVGCEPLNETSKHTYVDDFNKEDSPQVISTSFDYNKLPEYNGEPCVAINNNKPYFKEEEITTESFETYDELDSIGRCGIAYACISIETMPSPDEERGAIGNVKPSGWYSKKYDCVEGKFVMNRCHCIGWQLSAENANERNLVSGSRYMNLEMLKYENMVADYIRDTKNHVMYRVQPIFMNDELLCRGLLMEGYSVEDKGAGIEFCVFFYNVQPGIAFNYETGESWYTGEFLDKDSIAVNYEAVENTGAETTNTGVSPLPVEGKENTYVLNRNTYKFHVGDCKSVSSMNEKNKEIFEGNRDYLISIGYEPCGSCNP